MPKPHDLHTPESSFRIARTRAESQRASILMDKGHAISLALRMANLGRAQRLLVESLIFAAQCRSPSS
jgi:hypothetical protein